MRRLTLFFVVSVAVSSLAAGSGCTHPAEDGARRELSTGSGDAGSGGGGGTGGGTGGGSQSGCASDPDCPSGMICEGCPNGTKSCIPGCRENKQCDKDFLCAGGVSCLTCPCPPGWCQRDPCLDWDLDGYVQSKDPSVLCPGKLPGDCNDLNGNINPGRKEACGNNVDDNCDGKYDWQTPECGGCASGLSKCTGAFSCGALGTLYCAASATGNGCCERCAAPKVPNCPAGQSLSPGGTDPATGCAKDYTCVQSAACPSISAPVCGENFATYENECFAQVAGKRVLHTGSCLPGEGFSCDFKPVGTTQACGPTGQLYCRNVNPNNNPPEQRCTKRGVCVDDWDCPAGNAPARCDGGVATERCVNHACVAQCQ